MLKHEHYEELCALAATGQLGASDHAELTEHMANCPPCRIAYDDFVMILREMPAAEHSGLERASLRRMERAGLRERFLERANSEGIQFSSAALKQPVTWRLMFPWSVPRYQWVAAGVMLAILAGMAGNHFVARGKRRSILASSAPLTNATPPDDSRQIALVAKLSELQSQQEASEHTISSLKRENGMILNRFGLLQGELLRAHTEKQNLEATLARATEMNVQLASQSKDNAQLMAQTRDELMKARNDHAHMESDLTAERAEATELAQQVRLQKASLEREKELLVAGRDITDLMGARNLHIIDVYDADGRGKNRKSFGRVFYTEGKSLIFYAYDLDERKVADAKYAFAVWGEQLGEPTTVKSLGLLYADDKAQKRWALKVDDPRQLAEINSVFVTLEPRGKGDKPLGQRLLYAFLKTDANHP